LGLCACMRAQHGRSHCHPSSGHAQDPLPLWPRRHRRCRGTKKPNDSALCHVCHVLSPTGHTRTFIEPIDGTTPKEGVVPGLLLALGEPPCSASLQPLPPIVSCLSSCPSSGALLSCDVLWGRGQPWRPWSTCKPSWRADLRAFRPSRSGTPHPRGTLLDLPSLPAGTLVSLVSSHPSHPLPRAGSPVLPGAHPWG